MTRQRGNVIAAAARRRRGAIVRRLKLSTRQALLVSDPRDVGYLSGFTGEDSWLLVGRGWASLLTDGRFDEQARHECPGIAIAVRQGPMGEAIRQVVRQRPLRRVWFQPGHLTVGVRARLEEMLGARRLRPANDGLLAQRAVKDELEIRAIRRAGRIAESAFEWLLGRGSAWLIGKTERQVAAELDYRMRLAGADEAPFPTIVAAGAHSSIPHHRPGGARIRAGQAVLFDWGARKDGYCSDLTRVVFVRTIPPRLARVYEVVLRAQRAGIAAVRAGATGRAVDAAARGVIEQAGFARQFVHSLGHGIGREIHELPVLSSQATGRLRSGMVVTVEPGVYLPGVGGVRIEDDVLVVPGGCRRLTSLATAMDAMRLA